MPIKLLMFDLDGTIVDTSIDINNALNYALSHFGFNKISLDETKKLVGEGLTRLVEKVLGEKNVKLKDDVIKRFIDYYSEHLTDYSSLYPGVRETLEKLNNYTKTIISNKREMLSKRLLKSLNLSAYFDLIVGSDTVIGKKPSPAPLIYVISKYNVLPEESMIIGDSNYDIEAGKRAGVKTVAVTYGYKEKEYIKNADHMIDRFEDLLVVLDIK